MEDFEFELRQVTRFRKFEKEDGAMQEDRETRSDEDVEAHNVRNSTKNATKARNDEGDDVEAHNVRNSTKNSTKARNDEGDDVEGHMNFNNVKNNTKN